MYHNHHSTLDRALQRVIPDARVVKTELPLTGQIKLWLLDPDFHHYPYSSEESAAIMDAPPYWCFCWASGQVLAQHILENPDLVAGKSVLDFGSGSGVVAIACKLAGAQRVWACDIDPDARTATRINALTNGVELTTCTTLEEVLWKPDLLVAADILYDLDNHGFLQQFQEMAGRVLIADSRARTVAPEIYRMAEVRTATTLPDYGEFDEFRQVKIYGCTRYGVSALPC